MIPGYPGEPHPILTGGQPCPAVLKRMQVWRRERGWICGRRGQRGLLRRIVGASEAEMQTVSSRGSVLPRGGSVGGAWDLREVGPQSLGS